ncbi:MAG TPA: hypothetical protein VFC39_17055 [Acidobacteriaceae bacterium]|nr:hypothetical protein [Acidobacteriaceae bacterium]
MTQPDSDVDDMREEYDFSNSVRAPYAALAGDVHVVSLDPDVRSVFPDSVSVNTALRILIKAAKSVDQPEEYRKAS